MIVTLQGVLMHKSPTEIVVDVNGIGYGVSIPFSTFEVLGAPGSRVFLYTHLHVREDALHLFGFATDEERMTFRQLLAVNGIGPRIAQGILSGVPVSELRSHILQGNIAALTRVPGVGRKTAERLVVELREKVGRELPTTAPGGTVAEGPPSPRAEALRALVSLGYSRIAAEKAVAAAMQENTGGDATLESIIKSALRHTG